MLLFALCLLITSTAALLRPIHPQRDRDRWLLRCAYGYEKSDRWDDLMDGMDGGANAPVELVQGAAS